MNLSFRFVAIVATAALAIARPAAAQTNLVVNGGFEQSPIFAFDTTGWVPLPSTAFTSAVSHTGARSVAVGDPAAFEVGSLSQRLATTAGTNYTISFWATVAPGGQRPSVIGVAFTPPTASPSSWDYFFPEVPMAGSPNGATFTPTGNWAEYSMSAQATNDYTILQFYGANTYLDDVTVTTPEPSSVVILGTGLLALIPVVRRRPR